MTERKSIDSLKGIAILGVVLVHCGNQINVSKFGEIIFNGARGVQLLFVINGYLIFCSLDKIKLERKSVLKWWKQRILRIIPMYWFFTFINLCFFGLGPRYYLGPYNKISCLNILCNLFLIHGFYPYYCNSINVNWFMAVLALFYLIAPFMKIVIDSFERAIVLFMGVIPLNYILRHILLLYVKTDYSNIWNDYVNIFGFWAEFPVILVGILVFFMKKENFIDRVTNKRIMSYIFLLFFMFVLYSLIYKKNYFEFGYNIWSFGLAFGILLISQLIFPCKIISNNIFAFCGKHSYGIYLSHMVVLMQINNMNFSINNKNMDFIIHFGLVVILSIFISIIAEKIIENNIVIRKIKSKI